MYISCSREHGNEANYTVLHHTSLTEYLIDAVLHLEKICSGSSSSQVSVKIDNEHSGRITDNRS